MLVRNEDSENTEKRSLASFPKWNDEAGLWNSHYFEELGSWFSDHFAFRTTMVSLYSQISRHVFKSSSNEDVIVGEDGWLYYTPTVSDITGVRTLSDTDIRHMTRSLQLMSDYAKAHGSELIFACAPNKGSIYPEYLPARYINTGGMNNLDFLHESLLKTDVTVCDLRKALRDAAAESEDILYHKLDTHWNADGAMIGYQALMKTVGLDDRGYAALPRTVAEDWDGDLWDMLTPYSDKKDFNAHYALPETHQPVGRYRGTDDILITMKCKNGEGSLLMFRDSFAKKLIPMLSERFADTVYSRATHVPIADIENAQTDFIVYEIVERNLKNLTIYAPMMPAPTVSETGQPANAADAEAVSLAAKQEAQFIHFYGKYDARLADNDAVCCMISDDAGNSTIYEAFPCYEEELDGSGENGFSMYLPADTVPQNGTLTVLIQREGLSVHAGETAYSLEN